MGSILWGWGRGHFLTISPQFKGFHCGGTYFLTKNNQFLHIRVQIYFHNHFSSASTILVPTLPPLLIIHAQTLVMHHPSHPCQLHCQSVVGADLDRSTVKQFKVYSLYSIIYLSTLTTPSTLLCTRSPAHKSSMGFQSKSPGIPNSLVLLFLILHLDSSPSSQRHLAQLAKCYCHHR